MPATTSTSSEQDPPHLDLPSYATPPEVTAATGYIDPGVLKQYSGGMSGGAEQSQGQSGGDASASASGSGPLAATPSGPTQYRFGAWTGPFPGGSGAPSETTSAPDMSRRVASLSAADLRHPGDQYTSPLVQERAASVANVGDASQGGRGTNLPSMSAITASYPTQSYGSIGGDPRSAPDQRTAISSIVSHGPAQGMQTPQSQRSMGAPTHRLPMSGPPLGPSAGYMGQDTSMSSLSGPSASSGLQGLRMGTGSGTAYGELPPMSSSDPPSSGSRKRERDSWAGQVSDEDQQEGPAQGLASDDQPSKRGRGRPRGIKTSGKPDQPAYYSPEDTLPHVGSLLDQSAMQPSQYTHMQGMPTPEVIQSMFKGRGQSGLPMTPISSGRTPYQTQRGQAILTVDSFAEEMASLEGSFYQGVTELVSRTSGNILSESSAATGGNASRAQQVLANAINSVKTVSGAFVMPRSATVPAATARQGDVPGQTYQRALSQSEASSETYQTSRPEPSSLPSATQSSLPTMPAPPFQLQSVLNTDRPFPGGSYTGFQPNRQSFEALSSPFDYAPAPPAGPPLQSTFADTHLGDAASATPKYDAPSSVSYGATGFSQALSGSILPNPVGPPASGSAYPPYWQQGAFPSRPPILPPVGQMSAYTPATAAFDAQADSRSRSFAFRGDLPRLDPAQTGLTAGPYTSVPRYSADYSDPPQSALYQPMSAAADFAAGGSSSSAQAPMPTSAGGARQPSSDDSPKSDTGRRRRVVHGPWKDSEAERLTALVHSSKGRNAKLSPDEVDWDWVCQEFGPTRSRHQILIKATYLGLKPTSTHSSRLVRQKQFQGREEEVPGITPEKLDRIRAEKAAEASASGGGQSTSPQRLGTMGSLVQRMDQTGRGSIGGADVLQLTGRSGGDDPFARSSLSGYSTTLPSMTSGGQFYQPYAPPQQARPSTSGGMTYMTNMGGNRAAEGFDPQSSAQAPNDGR